MSSIGLIINILAAPNPSLLNCEPDQDAIASPAPAREPEPGKKEDGRLAWRRPSVESGLVRTTSIVVVPVHGVAVDVVGIVAGCIRHAEEGVGTGR